MIKPVVLTLLGCLPLCYGYSNGPPVDACESMTPGHGVDAQTSAAPFTITTNATTYVKGDPIKVTVEASNTSTPFRGFFIQARKANSTDAIGSFTIGTDTEMKLMTCPGGTDNAVSHSSSAQKIRKEFVWTNSAGSDVTFQATFVNVKVKYWTMVKSVLISEDTSSTDVQTTANPNSAVTARHCSFFILVLLAIALL